MDFSSFQLSDMPLPMYYQIKQFILENIKNGNLKVGDCLPPEVELMNIYKVSRSTIRQAITELTSEGILSRQKGKGTFVNPPKIHQGLLEILDSFSGEMTKKGYVPKTEVIDQSVVEAPDFILDVFDLNEGDKAIHLERLRSIDDIKLVYIDTYLPYEGLEGLLNEDLTNNSLYYLLENKYNRRVNRAVRKIEAAKADDSEAKHLNTAPDEPILRISTIAYNTNTPIEFTISRFRGENNEISVEVRR